MIEFGCASGKLLDCSLFFFFDNTRLLSVVSCLRSGTASHPKKKGGTAVNLKKAGSSFGGFNGGPNVTLGCFQAGQLPLLHACFRWCRPSPSEPECVFFLKKKVARDCD
jgi:hypothetical protein